MDIFLLEGQPHLHRACLSQALPNMGLSQYRVLCRPMSRLFRPRCWLSHSSCTSMDKSSNFSGPQCSICKLQTATVPNCWKYLADTSQACGTRSAMGLMQQLLFPSPLRLLHQREAENAHQ